MYLELLRGEGGECHLKNHPLVYILQDAFPHNVLLWLLSEDRDKGNCSSQLGEQHHHVGQHENDNFDNHHFDQHEDDFDQQDYEDQLGV